MSEWKEVYLNQAFDICSGLSKPAQDFGSGFPFLSFKTIFDNFFVPKNLLELVESSDKERHRCSVKRGDVFLTRTSETVKELGMSCVALKDYENATFNGFTKRLRPNGKFEIVPEYAGYYFRSPKFRAEVTALSSASTRASLNNEMLGRLKIVLPSREEQKRIAAVLSCLDDKIENLRKQNETLEKIAQTLFKHWFIDFEFPNENGQPYRSSGGAMQPSELGAIPAGWRVGKLGDVTVTITKGTTPTTLKKQFKDSGINFVKAESITDIHSIDISKFAYIDDETNQLLKRSILNKNDILYTIAGTIGRYAVVSESILPANTNQAVAIIRPDIQKIDPEYLLCYFSSKNYQHYLSSRVVQAVQANLSLGILSDSPIVLPDQRIKYEFEKLAKSIFHKKEINFQQIQTLTKTRDRLLPELMSGKLRVPE